MSIMKGIRKWIALLLSLSILLATGIVALAEDIGEGVAQEEAVAEEAVAEAVPEEDAAEVVLAEIPEESYSYYENYVSIGDSCGSGVGLPQYLELAAERGQRWLACEQIEGSYPVRVAEAIGAKTLGQYHFPGARSEDIRYLLDPNYPADWVLTGQAAILSNGVVSKANLDAYRDEVLESIRNADLITIDVGINDVWLPVVAALYDIADSGRIGFRPLTVPELVMRYGSVGALLSNTTSFLSAWLFEPLNWLTFGFKLTSALVKWVLDYQINVGAIMDRIYQLNPNAKVVVCGMYNPIEGWDLLPFVNDNILEHVLQPYYSLLNLRKQAAVLFYRGDATYVRMDDVELISDSFTIPLFEFTTEQDSFGYNPHPTLKGAETQTRHILNALGIPMP